MNLKNPFPSFKKPFIIITALAFVLLFSGMASALMKSRTYSQQEINAMKKVRAEIITKYGTIVLRFFPEVAPNHVDNFIRLAKEGFYDGTTFHRVIPGFMIQGGNPATKPGANPNVQGPGYTLKEEFNSKPFLRGTLGMARTADPNSAGSQFFICVHESPWLNGQYTVFGEVVSGMDVADKIVNVPRDASDKPLDNIEMKVRIIEEK